MDGRRFDRWTKIVVTTPSRRNIVRGLAGGSLAALIGQFGLGGAGAGTSRRPIST